MKAGRAGAPGIAVNAVLGGGFLLSLLVNLPGHLTLDSVLELYEGRYRIRQSWAPSFYAWLLGVFDAVRPGTGLYLVASGLVLLAAFVSLAALRRRASWWAAAVACGMVLSPMLLIYQGIVWKDVLFANVAIAGMVCVAWAARCWPQPGRRGLLLAVALLLLAAAALIRQNGAVVAVFAAAAVAWTASEGRWARALAWGVGALAAAVLVSHGMNLATQPGGAGSGDGVSEGLRMLQNYDLLGAVWQDRTTPLRSIEAANPAAARTLRSGARRFYSPERTDFADAQPAIQQAFAAVPASAVASDWRDLILRRPGPYLRQRASVFRWVFLTPRIERCVPVCLGVDGPPETLAELGLSRRWSATDTRLLQYDKAFQHTLVYSHFTYAALAVLLTGLLLLRRDPADVVMAALLLSALAFAASFFVISIACDYRYLYYLDLAAMTGLLYWALDPSLSPGRGQSV